MQAQSPVAPNSGAQYQPLTSEVERIYKESIKLKDAVAYRNKIAELAQAIQSQIDSGLLNTTEGRVYGKNLKDLIAEPNNNKPVTPVDRYLAKYVTEAYKTFVDGNESPLYKQALNNVTTKLQAMKVNFNNNNPVAPYQLDDFNLSLRHAKTKRPLSKNQKALNVAALCVFIGIALTCSIVAPYVGLLAAHLVLSLVSMASVGFAIYTGVQMARRQPTIFNPKPVECRTANQTVSSMQRLTPAKS